MKSIRILIVTHAPLAPEFGAGQMAINLAEAFREQGHDVTLWSPHPLPPQIRWWQRLQNMRSKLNAFLDTQESFDVIDMPGGAGLISQKIRKSAPVVVARSVQPPILYVLQGLSNSRKTRFKKVASIFIHKIYSIFFIFLILQDWMMANHILCLGSLELHWMKKWFPWWKGKLFSYINALSQVDQKALYQITLTRKKYKKEGIRFLWIGRWIAQKGITELLDFIVKRAASCSYDTFTIAGCGCEAEKDCPTELLRSGRLKLLPSFDRSELYSLLASHDVGLFTSRIEGWGLVLNEMIESGMTVFATPVGGVPDLQSFCKDMLRPFPPPLELTYSTLATPEIQKDYLQMFNWSAIAIKYEEEIIKNN